jgi:hypothetical protein
MASNGSSGGGNGDSGVPDVYAGDSGFEYDVQLYLYDLSKGMASAMSQALLGTQIDGICE